MDLFRPSGSSIDFKNNNRSVNASRRATHLDYFDVSFSCQSHLDVTESNAVNVPEIFSG